MPFKTKEEKAAYDREYRAKYRAKKLAQGAAWRASEKNRAKQAEYLRKYYVENRDKLLARAIAWPAANPEKKAIQSHKRRALETAAGSYTLDEWRAVMDQYGHRCRMCACEGKMTVDHVIPLSKGGSNTVENLSPLCKPCNSRKNNRILAWLG